jgi:hypothetical protein
MYNKIDELKNFFNKVNIQLGEVQNYKNEKELYNV